MTSQIIVSLNGPDNVGKTTQIFHLPEFFEKRSSIHNYDDEMKELVENNKLQKWWFETSTVEEFITVIMRAICKRAAITTSKEIVVFDRGPIMFEAVCIATIAIKKSCDLNEAKSIYEAVKSALGINLPCENINILLTHGRSIEESVKISLIRQEKYDNVYENYQNLLQRQLALQKSKNLYTNVINATGMSVIEVQNEIRNIINSRIPPGSKTKTVSLMFQNLHTVVAFGGLSESGKSTLAEKTCKKLEAIGEKSVRLKIAYFMELISTQLGSNIYHLPEEQQVNLLVRELDRYAQFHYWLNIITIESLHNLIPTKLLKQALGDKLQIVYIEVSQEIRMQRSLTDINELLLKDVIKSSRGADKIKSEIDCFVLVNEDCTIDESTSNIMDMLESKIWQIATQALHNNPYTNKISLSSTEFVLSAGSILINKSNRKVCLIHQLGGNREWLLPKGRKNVNESLQEAAIRETYEETGFKCSLMPVAMETRATPGGKHTEDVSRRVSNIIEPFMISLRQIRGCKRNQKIIFWYLTQIEEQIPRTLDTQMPNENFEACLVSLDEANKLLTHEEDRRLVQMAFKIFEQSCQSNGSIL